MSSTPLSRREVLAAGLAGAASVMMPGFPKVLAPAKPWFEISLAEWSLHKALFAGKITNLDFPKLARQEFGIGGVEYVNSFFKTKAWDLPYLRELNRIAAGEGVKNVLIMVDGEGQMGDPDAAGRARAVENHKQWVEAAKFLGCHSIRVNAYSRGSREEQAKLCADGLAQLGAYAAKARINVIVENHGGLSSDGQWLSDVMKSVGMKNVGTLPDFGNFYEYDRYQGTQDMMPFAKGVSAKSHDFGADGGETTKDYARLLKIVKEAGYRGFIGIEYEGSRLDEYEGIKATKALLEKLRDQV